MPAPLVPVPEIHCGLSLGAFVPRQTAAPKRSAQNTAVTMATELPPEVAEELAECLKRLAAGNQCARDKILEVCNDRLRELSSRLLGKFSKVRRWDNTDDVAQNAALRLYRALGDTVPDSPRGLMGLMATQIQRELIDLARKHSGPMSYAKNHDTNVRDGSQGDVFLVDEAPQDGKQEEEIPMARWEAFHKAVEQLPEEHREVFRLAWYLGLDQNAVAQTLGLSRRTVQRKWQEARELIAKTMGEEG
jgi:RNA polymerase sigma factor (sigma-70 family)